MSYNPLKSNGSTNQIVVWKDSTTISGYNSMLFSNDPVDLGPSTDNTLPGLQLIGDGHLASGEYLPGITFKSNDPDKTTESSKVFGVITFLNKEDVEDNLDGLSVLSIWSRSGQFLRNTMEHGWDGRFASAHDLDNYPLEGDTRWLFSSNKEGPLEFRIQNKGLFVNTQTNLIVQTKYSTFGSQLKLQASHPDSTHTYFGSTGGDIDTAIVSNANLAIEVPAGNALRLGTTTTRRLEISDYQVRIDSNGLVETYGTGFRMGGVATPIDNGLIVDNAIATDTSLFIKEKSTAPVSSQTSYGQIWVKNAAPNTLWFTDDEGNNFQLGTGGIGVTVEGTPVSGQIPIWTDANTIKGEAGLYWTDAESRLTAPKLRSTDLRVNDDISVAGNLIFQTNDGVASTNYLKIYPSSAGKVALYDNDTNYDFDLMSFGDWDNDDYPALEMELINGVRGLRIRNSTNNAYMPFGAGHTHVAGTLKLQEVSSGIISESGWGQLYAKANGKVYFKNDDDVEYDLTTTEGTGGGGGDVNTVGIPTDNQIAVWTSSGYIEGSNDFTWTGSNLHVQIADAGLAPHTSYDDVFIESDGNLGMTLMCGSGDSTFLVFADNTDNDKAYLQYDHNINKFYLKTSSYGFDFRSDGTFKASNIGVSAGTLNDPSLTLGISSLNVGMYNSGAYALGIACDGTLSCEFSPDYVMPKVPVKAESALYLKELSAMVGNETGYGQIYANTDGSLRYKAHDGTEVNLTGNLKYGTGYGTNRVAVWGATFPNIDGDGDFTWNGSTLSIIGAISVTGNVDGRNVANDGSALDSHLSSTSIHKAEGDIHHGALSGLDDDDHTHYLLVNGTRALSADWDAGAYKIRARQLQSDITTGTAPLIIQSTTVVTNLNADRLDGNHASAFALSANGVTNGDSHDHSDGDGAQIDHTTLSNKGTNTHSQIDTHISSNHVNSFNTRTGAVTPATNDYTWAQINKTTSDIADITTKSHTSLTDKGTNTHAQIDTHLGAASPHSSHVVIGSNPLDNRLAVWNNTTTIEGDSDLTWDGTTLDVAGNALIGGAVNNNRSLSIATNEENNRYILFKTDNSTRWAVICNNAEETGSNEGSNFSIARYADNGTHIGNVLHANRATGDIRTYFDLAVEGSLTINDSYDVASGIQQGSYTNIQGANGTWTTSIQDGNGRVNMYWNAYPTGSDTWSAWKANDRPSRLLIGNTGRFDWYISTATPTVAGESVTWNDAAFSIDNAGNVGINNESPNTKLDVAGNIGTTGDIIIRTSSQGIRTDTSNDNDNQYVRFTGGGGFGDTRGAQVTAFGNEVIGFEGLLSLVAGNDAALGTIRMTTGNTTRVTVEYDGDVTCANALTVGSAASAAAGAIQWDGSNFQGYTGSAWVDLDTQDAVDGSGATNQISYWSDSNTLTGSNNLTYGGTVLTIAGNLTGGGLTLDSSTGVGINMKRPDLSNRACRLRYWTNAIEQWGVEMVISSDTLRIYDVASGVEAMRFTQGITGETVINEAGIGRDFRVESTNDTHLLFVDASHDRIGIGTDNPNSILHVKSQFPTIRLEDTDGGGEYSRILVDGATTLIDADGGNSGASSEIGFNVDNSRKVTIDASGNIAVTGTVDGLDLQTHNHSGANQGGTVSHTDLDNLNSASYTHLTSTNHTDLTDGGATTLHKHDHGGMDGLDGDDHTHYLLANGTRTLSANWDAGSHKITAWQFESDIVTGNSPLIVASTTLVNNLNADLLDGNEASAFAPAAEGVTNGNSHDHNDGDGAQIAHTSLSSISTDDHHPQSHNIASHSDTSATGTELNTLTNGGSSDADSLHTHGTYDTHVSAASPHTGHPDISGTPEINQVALWTDEDTLKGNANLTYGGTALKIAGNLGGGGLTLDSTTGVGIYLDRDNTSAACRTTYRTDGIAQWRTELSTGGTNDFRLYDIAVSSGIIMNCVQGSEVVFNESSKDLDFRVESNINANMFFVDGGEARIGIGTNAPAAFMHLETSDSNPNLSTTTNSLRISLDGGNAWEYLNVFKYNAFTSVIQNVAGINNVSNLLLEAVQNGASTQDAFVGINRLTETTGDSALRIFNADGTDGENCRLGCNVDSFLNVNTGNVGIGTDTPGSILHVYHDTTDTVALFESGDASVAISLADGNTFSTQNNQIRAVGEELRLKAGGTATLFVKNDKVGIGDSPTTEQLEVEGAIKIGDAAGTGDGTIRWNATNFEGYNSGWVRLDITDHGDLSGKDGDAHPQYLLVADIDTVPTEGATSVPVSSAWVYTHAVTLSDPHPIYRKESEDHSHQSTGLQGGKLDHGLALDGLGDDDHTQYLNETRHDALPSDNPHSVTAAQVNAPALGTRADNQIAIWNGTTTLDGDANLTWDGTTLDIDGGTLSDTNGTELDMLELHSLTSSNDYLKFFFKRTSTGTTTATATPIIGRTVETTDYGFIGFGTDGIGINQDKPVAALHVHRLNSGDPCEVVLDRTGDAVMATDYNAISFITSGGIDNFLGEGNGEGVQIVGCGAIWNQNTLQRESLLFRKWNGTSWQDIMLLGRGSVEVQIYNDVLIDTKLIVGNTINTRNLINITTNNGGIQFLNHLDLDEYSQITGNDGSLIISADEGLNTVTSSVKLRVRNQTVIRTEYSGVTIGGDVSPANKLDVDGAVVIGSGSSYAGSATAPTNGLLVEGDVECDDGLLIGTSTIPHGNVGMCKLAIHGTNGNAAGPHVQFTTGTTDDYPLMQIMPWTHDNVQINFDAFFNGTAWRSSDAGSNFQIRKSNDMLRFRYDSGVATGVGGTVDWIEGIVLDTNGHIGIGQTFSGIITPKAELHIDKGSENTSAAIQLEHDGGSGGQWTGIGLSTKGDGQLIGGTNQGWRFIAYGDSYTTSLFQNQLQLLYYNGTSNQYAMRFDTSGRVSIGSNTNPSYVLHVRDGTGSNYVTSIENSNNTDGDKALRIICGSNSPTTAGDCKWIGLLDGDGTPLSYIQNVNSSGAQFSNTSDARLKTNITPTAINGLDIVNNLPLRQFDWINKPDSHQDIGFIAQEVQDIYPSMVSYDKENDTYMVADGTLVPVLVKAVQEQQDVIEEQKQKINSLESRLAALETLLIKE